MSNARSNLSNTDDPSQNWQEIVRRHVESLHFGTVEIIIHDSRVIQIEKTERVRLANRGASPAADAVKLGSDTRSGRQE